MLFNSYEFIFILLPVTFFVYFYLNHKRLTVASKIWLILTCLFFYSWWNIIYLPLLLFSILFNFGISYVILDDRVRGRVRLSKKILLQIGLFFNIMLLGYFKYMDFFLSNMNSLFSFNFDLLHLALPLAISFFTLQQIAFLVDCYEGLVDENKFLDYVIFVSFFPQLIAGPIVHHKEMMPQFSSIKNKVKNYENIALGLFIFSIGLFKKVVLADTFSVWATYGFDVSDSLNLFEAWSTSFSYTFQLYFDFSGYTDMAIGSALLFNIKLPCNFNSPYKATGMIDFWQRWHMTLSSFITTYLYTPLVRRFDKLTFNKAMLTTFIVFVIAGLWHGASWMFVIFGALHGLGLVINHIWKKRKFKLPKSFAWILTFNFVNISFVFFRAKEWSDAVKVLGSMFSVENVVLPRFLFSKLSFLTDYGIYFDEFSYISGNKYTLMWLLIAIVIVLFFKNSSEYIRSFKPTIKYQVFNILLLFISLILIGDFSEFLYFNF